MEKRLLLFGCGGHSRSVADIYLAEHPGHEILFLDEQAKPGETLFGFPVLTACSLPLPHFFAIGDNVKRFYIYNQIGAAQLITIQSSKAHLGKEASLGKGCFIGNYSHIGPQAQIGDNTIINNGAIVEHEVRIGAHSHIGPRAVISGRSRIGDLVFIGVGASVKDNIAICSCVILGAGATVVKPIIEPGVYVGCPARKIKEFPAHG